jgi:CBS domain-containing membrane protein
MRSSIKNLLRRCLFYFGGDQPWVGWVERLRSCAGAFIGLLLVLFLAKIFGEFAGMGEWLMASLGASALLVFALPQSPMAQPWAVIAGNSLSALVGITSVHLVGDSLLAMPIAVAISIMGMFLLRCLHPPAAAVAMIAVLSHVEYYQYAFFPIMIDSVLLVVAGLIYNNLTGKRYPNQPVA